MKRDLKKCAFMKFWFLKKFKNVFKKNFVILRRSLFLRRKKLFEKNFVIDV